jgi:hypothetical protein
MLRSSLTARLHKDKTKARTVKVALMFFSDLEDGDTSEDSRVDRAINEVSFDLGISYFGPTTGSLERARLSLANDIRKRFCE